MIRKPIVLNDDNELAQLPDADQLPPSCAIGMLGYISGSYVDQSLVALASTTLTGAANRMELAPFVPQSTFTIDRIGTYVTTGVAATEIKFLVYGSNALGWPDSKLFESGALSSATTNSAVEATTSLTFVGGKVYWLGIRHSGAAATRAIALGAAASLGLTQSGTAYFTTLRRTLAFATGAPDPWNFLPSDRASGVAPASIRMRVA